MDLAELLREATMNAPLQSLFVAFLLGLWIARHSATPVLIFFATGDHFDLGRGLAGFPGARADISALLFQGV